MPQHHLPSRNQYDGLYFAASQIPYSDQYKLGKCRQEDHICAQEYIDYINQHNIKYLVIERENNTYIYQQLANVGSMIFDNGVKIFKLR